MRRRAVDLSLSALLAATVLPGCAQESPLGVAMIETPDSVRYVSTPGTPQCVATVWSNGKVNLAARVHAEAQNRSDFCVARGTLAWSGTRHESQVAGALCTSGDLDPMIFVDAGEMVLTFNPDGSLSGLVDAVLSTPCGPATVALPVELVRWDALEVP